MPEVLVVDDSAVVRQMMTSILGVLPDMNVVTAADPMIAMRKIEQRRPDVIVLDIEMPRMNGLVFLRKIMSEDPIPVVICSSMTTANSEGSMQALQLGAVDVLLKPRLLTDAAVLLVDTIRAAAQANVGRRVRRGAVPLNSLPEHRRSPGLVVIGASTGGTEALKIVLDAMPADGPPMAIVQHMPERFTSAFARRLNESSAMEVREARDGDLLRRGLALIAPGDKHLRVVRHPSGLVARVAAGELVSRHRPSVDVLFGSAAQVAGPSFVAVLMSGMGRDGANGMMELRKAGAFTIAQDESTSVVFGMPRAAIEAGAACEVMAIERIADAILSVPALRHPTNRA
ncbi:MAG: chemotaxis response regulator protein-glutamate methylesterase [Thermoanaerobaculia bacterium]|nr:chemotaxis response regulator protein-glutamate methylesterase [Thermoanaerobaculia bacterium]